MLELYHGTTSVTRKRARLALAEKGPEWQSHLMTLNGDQLDPAYLKLNPNGVVPTLVNDGNVIIESTVILHYLDDTSRALPSGGSASKRPSYETAITKWLRREDIARSEKITDPWINIRKNLAEEARKGE